MVDDVGSDVPLPSLTPKSTFWHYRIPHTPPTLLLRLFNPTLPVSVLLEALVGMVYSMDVIGASQEDPNGGEWCGSKVSDEGRGTRGGSKCAKSGSKSAIRRRRSAARSPFVHTDL